MMGHCTFIELNVFFLILTGCSVHAYEYYIIIDSVCIYIYI